MQDTHFGVSIVVSLDFFVCHGGVVDDRIYNSVCGWVFDDCFGTSLEN